MARFSTRIMVSILSAFVAAPALSANYTSTVSELQSNHDTQDCIFFRLSGVTGITPASVGDWFAISRASLGAMETFALLLSSRVKAIPVKVTTTSAMACGYAEATYVIM